MEIAWLEDFLALAESGHFSRAAEQRNITQPAFSRRIRALEDWAGAPLFDRNTHRVELTPAGEVFRPIAAEIVRRIYLGRSQARDAARLSAETIRFGSTHALSLYFFPDWLRQIEERERIEATVSLVTDNMVGCERLMVQGQIHFLLYHHHPSTKTVLNPEQFHAQAIGRDVLIPLSVPKSPRSSQPKFELPGTPESPVAHLAYSASSGMGRILNSTRTIDVPPVWLSTVFTSHVATVLVAMTRTGRGVAWLPESVAGRLVDTGELVRAGGPEWDVEMEVRICRARARQSPAVERLWSMIKRGPAPG